MCERICTIMVENQSVTPSSSECRTIPSQAAYSSSVASQCSQLQSNPTIMRYEIRETDLFHIILKSIILQIHSCSFKFFSVSWIGSENLDLKCFVYCYSYYYTTNTCKNVFEIKTRLLRLSNSHTKRRDCESHSWTVALFNPTAMYLPSGAHEMLVTGPSSSTVKSSSMELVVASQRYTVLPKATAKMLFTLQSSRLR